MSQMLDLKPLEMPVTLRDHLYRVLLDAILDVNIYDEHADLKLDERDLAERLGVSRTPTREALAKLEQEGFVTILPRRGVFIRRKTRIEILEMVIVWAALESMAISLACERATDDAIESLHVLQQKHTSASAQADTEVYAEANFEFHRRILEL